MKRIQFILIPLAAAALGLPLVSCTEKKGPAEEIGEKIDDATDQRPGEKVRDAVEDVVE